MYGPGDPRALNYTNWTCCLSVIVPHPTCTFQQLLRWLPQTDSSSATIPDVAGVFLMDGDYLTVARGTGLEDHFRSAAATEGNTWNRLIARRTVGTH